VALVPILPIHCLRKDVKTKAISSENTHNINCFEAKKSTYTYKYNPWKSDKDVFKTNVFYEVMNNNQMKHCKLRTWIINK